MTFSAGFGLPMATPTSVLAHILLARRNFFGYIYLSTKSILNLKTVMQFSGMLPSPGPCTFLKENHEV